MKTVNGVQYNVAAIKGMAFDEFAKTQKSLTKEQAERVWTELGLAKPAKKAKKADK